MKSVATDQLRDGVFLLAWFGLMTCVWLGWAQEDPPRRARALLGGGSVLGLLAAGGGGYLVATNWQQSSALEGRYALFGILVAVEVVAAGAACWWLATRSRRQWYAVAVALVVAAHFAPLGVLLADAGLVALSLVQVTLVVLAARLAQRRGLAPSFAVGAVMGATLLLSALGAAVRWVPQAV